jgi:hypothetical protein
MYTLDTAEPGSLIPPVPPAPPGLPHLPADAPRPGPLGPGRGPAVAIVITTMTLATILYLTGHTAGAALGLLAGAAYLGLEIVSRLGGPPPGGAAGGGAQHG